MVIPRNLKGFVKSTYLALSGLITNGATIISASPANSSPIIPFHCIFPDALDFKKKDMRRNDV